MADYRFDVFWSERDNAYVATCPDFPGVSGFGPTRTKAVAEAEISLELMIEGYEEEGWELPSPHSVPSVSGKFALRLPKSLHAQLTQQAEFEGVSLNAWMTTLLADRSALRQVDLMQRAILAQLRVMPQRVLSVLQPSISAQNVSVAQVIVGDPYVPGRHGAQTPDWLRLQPSSQGGPHA